MAGFIQLPEPNQEATSQTISQATEKRYLVRRYGEGFYQEIDLPAADADDAVRQAKELFSHRKAEKPDYTIVFPGFPDNPADHAPDVYDVDSWFYAA